MILREGTNHLFVWDMLCDSLRVGREGDALTMAALKCVEIISRNDKILRSYEGPFVEKMIGMYPFSLSLSPTESSHYSCLQQLQSWNVCLARLGSYLFGQ